MIRRRELATAATLALLFGAAPTPGDVGACSQPAESLEERAFSAARARLDCRRCTDCKLDSSRCARACITADGYVTFPVTCRPLLQDGQVCLRALQAASCAKYVSYVADQARAAPTECDFCRVSGAVEAPGPTFDDDAGAREAGP